MTVIAPPRVRGTTAADLIVTRRDIEFRNLDPTTVEVEITVHNSGNAPSRPTVLALESAELGAFVAPYRRFELPVPAISPGRAQVVRRQLRAPAPLAGVEGRALVRGPGAGLGRGDPDLPANPLTLLRRGRATWAGNFNVFIGRVSVERHRASGFGVRPGQCNLADFSVGTGRDEYAFETRGVDWGCDLFLIGRRELPHLSSLQSPLPKGEWIPLHGRSTVLLLIEPPQDAGRGSLDVLVTQRSSGREAVVEFDLVARRGGRLRR